MSDNEDIAAAVVEKPGGLATLRTPFEAGQIGKLPRVTCPKCRDRKVQCDEHQEAWCDTCKARVGKHMHIDYVGHGDVTIRLLEADPEWNWEPKAEDEHGLPVFDTNARGEPVGLWIKLTACGVTRLGYGSVPDGQFDAVKVLIGDALRNAAMRFGVALDLWAKGDRADPTAENATASSGTAVRRTGKRENPFDTPLDDGPPKRAERLRGTPPDDQWQTPKPIAPRQAPPGTTDVPLPDGVWQAPVTDQEWLTGVNSKIQVWNTQDEGNKVWAGVVDQKNAGKLAPADFAKLRAAFQDRSRWLKENAPDGWPEGTEGSAANKTGAKR